MDDHLDTLLQSRVVFRLQHEKQVQRTTSQTINYSECTCASNKLSKLPEQGWQGKLGLPSVDHV